MSTVIAIEKFSFYFSEDSFQVWINAYFEACWPSLNINNLIHVAMQNFFRGGGGKGWELSHIIRSGKYNSIFL